ncbi:hypothetical protein H257_12649 [Aphanomyces astaci]|uniref:Uncharacterized protein n=1 Tax=Aphanomyces astaci TaxID=112090 RepID=W4FZT7_APHAT|nr:hypothetical protein H257_12649 [Aphanomyces astaci]ETV72173.1 hypothetical protein H257_12649 [Aphanomyces astaci]|eukprot:XP_009838241.1 hypothetical protein H257_12649 [Aphanomyces astaci]
MSKLLEPLDPHQASLGLTLAYFHHFIDIHGGRDVVESLATIDRTWCVFEVYLSIVLQTRFEIAMTKAQKTVFLDEMLLHSNDVLEMMSQVSSKHSTTTVSRDRDHIFDLIEKQVGFAELDPLDCQLTTAISPSEHFRSLCSKASALIALGSLTQDEGLLLKVVAMSVDEISHRPRLRDGTP